jgi:hypothetical protein
MRAHHLFDANPMTMKVVTGPNAPPPAPATALPRHAWIVGAAFALFALGAFAAALVLEGPG